MKHKFLIFCMIVGGVLIIAPTILFVYEIFSSDVIPLPVKILMAGLGVFSISSIAFINLVRGVR